MEAEEPQSVSSPPPPPTVDDTDMPDAQIKPDAASDSDDSPSSDSDSDTETNQALELQNLESQLSTNPSNYDAHVQYIALLRKMGEIDKLRLAREAMNTLFPLTPALWQEWAKDEASHSKAPLVPTAVENLYERGISDYLSIPLWCDYLNYVREHDPSVHEYTPNGISKARSLFERAITAAGLHVKEGSKIWDSYRDFELSVLRTIDDANVQEKEKQLQRVRSMFHRQLSVPLADLKSALVNYKAWEVENGSVLDTESDDVDGISPKVAAAYKKALEMYNARAQFEEEIARQDLSEAEKFQNFMNYLKFEKSSGDPARVQLLYERAVTEFPVSTDIWLDYTRYLDKTLKVGKIVRDVYSRATRNCPWVGELWVHYLLCLERGHASERDFSDVFEKSLQCTFSTLEEYLDLFLTRIDGLRRRISLVKEGEDVLNYSLIQQTFQQASDYLSPQMNQTDGLLHLYSYWARLELTLGKDLDAARRVWENLLKICSIFEAWQGYIRMEIESGHMKEARSLYKRCYSRSFSGTGSEDICHAWLRFEREFGMLDDFDRAVQKVSPRLDELKLYRSQQEAVSIAGSTDQKEPTTKKPAREKRKAAPKATDEKSPSKRQKNASKDEKKRNQKSNPQEQKKAETNEGDKPKGEVGEPEAAAGKRKVYTDQCTAFISNLNVKATYEDVRKFFSDVGGVTSIRILNDRFTGKSRGLAYVDFEDDEHLAAAVAKNKQPLLEKKLSIARSNPKQNRGEGGKAGRRGGGDSSGNNSRREEEVVELKGKNTFAAPRNVRALGWAAAEKAKGVEEEEEEKPKSNEEFRKMLMKKKE